MALPGRFYTSTILHLSDNFMQGCYLCKLCKLSAGHIHVNSYCIVEDKNDHYSVMFRL